jgi:hypothetical protein
VANAKQRIEIMETILTVAVIGCGLVMAFFSFVWPWIRKVTPAGATTVGDSVDLTVDRTEAKAALWLLSRLFGEYGNTATAKAIIDFRPEIDLWSKLPSSPVVASNAPTVADLAVRLTAAEAQLAGAKTV